MFASSRNTRASASRNLMMGIEEDSESEDDEGTGESKDSEDPEDPDGKKVPPKRELKK